MTITITPSELTVEQFMEALSDPAITYPDDLLVLQTLYSFEGHRGSLTDVVNLTQNSSLRAFNRMRIVERIARRFSIDLTERNQKEFKYWDMLFNGESVKRIGCRHRLFEWILKPELAKALEELGLCDET